METSRFHRKTYLIKRAFQLKFIGAFVVLLAAGSAISGLMIYFLASQEIHTSLTSAHLALRSTWNILMPAVIITHITTILFVAFAAAFFVLYYSNRVAGPLYRLERTADQIGDGDLTVQVRFRQRDEIADFRESFQSMVDSLASKVRAFRGPASEMKALAANLRRAMDNSSMSVSEKEEMIRSLEKITADLENAARGFQLPGDPKAEG